MTGRRRAVSLVLCALVAMADGFDAQAIGFVAPKIVSVLHIEPRLLGIIFAAGLVGLTLGALTLSVLADRIGRRPVILLSVLVFALCSLGTATAGSAFELLVWRFLTGIGLGGALPNVNALSAELAPPRWRASLMTLMFAGFPLGGVIGGLASARILAVADWQAVFVLGGLFPLLLLIPLWFLLDESPEFRRSTDHSRAIPQGPQGLFRDGRALATPMLWLACFCSLLLMYTILNWLPSVLTAGGLPVGRAIHAAALFNLGGILGGLTLAVAIDRGARAGMLAAMFVLATATVVSLGHLELGGAVLLGAVTLAGVTVMGTQLGLNAVIAAFYPSTLRATGLGWALGIGRVGSIVGPLLVGFVVAAQWSLESIFTSLAVPALIAAAAMLIFAATSRGGHEPAR